MDDEHVDRELFSMSLNMYTESLEGFIESTRVLDLKMRHALIGEDFESVAGYAGQIHMGASSVQVGNIPNLIAGFAHALNDERQAGIQMHDLGLDVLAKLQAFHAHLVYIGQPTEELLMITDIMAGLRQGLAESSYETKEIK